MTTRLALTLLLGCTLLGAGSTALASLPTTYYGRIDFSGTSTAGSTLYIQLRDATGTTTCATSNGFPLPASTSALDARDAVALGWRIIDDGACWTGTTARCRTGTFDGLPALCIETDGAGFRVYASTDSSSWAQIVSGSPFSFGSGLQIRAGADTGSNIPTLSEWGLILLAAAVGLGGLWTLRRRPATAA